MFQFGFLRSLYLASFLVVVNCTNPNDANLPNITYFRVGQNVSLTCGEQISTNHTLVVWNDARNKSALGYHYNITNVNYSHSGIYRCTVFSGPKKTSVTVIQVLVKGLPNPPTGITFVGTPYSLNVSWTFGSNGHSPILMHTLHLYRSDPQLLESEQNVTAPRYHAIFRNLEPYTCYGLIIRALNDVGYSDLSNMTYGLTLPGRPSIRPIVRIINTTNDSALVEVDKSFIQPVRNNTKSRCRTQDLYVAELYGPLKEYIIHIATTKPPQSVGNLTLPASTTPTEILTIPNLKSRTTYNLSFTFSNGAFTGPWSHHTVVTLGLPEPPRHVFVRSTSNSIIVDWKDNPVHDELVNSYKIELYHCNSRNSSNGVLNRTLRLNMSRVGAKQNYFMFDNLNPSSCYSVRVAAGDQTGFGQFGEFYDVYTAPVELSVDDLEDCSSSLDCKSDNMRLDPMKLKLSEIPDQRHLKSSIKSRFKLDSAAIGSIIAITLLVFFCVTLGACFASRLRCLLDVCNQSAICYRTTETPAKYRRITPFRLNKTAYKVIPISELRAYVSSCHADDDSGFQSEFEAIEHTVSGDWPTHVARLPENMAKNRYSNVLAYDHTKVILRETGAKSDYINANYVDGYHRRSAYIAAQGPIPSTFDDFWLMVWEQACNIIVMISNFIERGRRKCDKYWPSSGHQTYGNICVRMVSETIRAFYTIRIFSIRNTKCKRGTKERLIYHYQYTDWRDFDVPPSPLPVLKFVEASISHWSMEDGPIVVHCSAGVGRTGTYICIESLIRQLKTEQAVSVRGFLEHIRQQRMKLVQTEQQYAFIHDALCEYILLPSHSILPSLLPDHLRHLREIDSNGLSNMEKQFQMCIDFGYELGETVRSRTLSSLGRISFLRSSGMSDSCGIDSSVLHGFRNLGEYIVTRHPEAGTETEFWKMVWDENSSTIVCLSTPDMAPFWPDQANKIRDIGWLHVGFAGHTAISDSLSRYEFLLTSDREDYALVCTLWRFTSWPSVELESPSEASVANELLDLAAHLMDDDPDAQGSIAPLLVVDNTGGIRVGTFCAIRNLISQLVHDNLLDIYFVFKMLCFQRPHMFQSYHDLEFIYLLMQHYLSKEPTSPIHSGYATYGNVPSILELPNSNKPSLHIRLPIKPTMNNFFVTKTKQLGHKSLGDGTCNGSALFDHHSISTDFHIEDDEASATPVTQINEADAESSSTQNDASPEQPLLHSTNNIHPHPHSTYFLFDPETQLHRSRSVRISKPISNHRLSSSVLHSAFKHANKSEYPTL